MKKKKVAIIGAGASGAVANWLLDEHFETYLLEASNKTGGHADTHKVGNKEVPVDVGAAFINEQYCPNLYKILRHYKISTLTFTLVTHFYNKNSGQDITLPPAYFDDKGRPTIELKSLLSFKNIRTMLMLQVILDYSKKLFKYKNTDITLEDFLDGIKILGIPLLTRSFKEEFFYPLLANAYFVDQQSYTFTELTENCTINKHTFYVRLDPDCLHYEVISPIGERIHDSIDYSMIEGTSLAAKSMEQVLQRKQQILKITCERGHTFHEDPDIDIRRFSAYSALNYLIQGSSVKHYQWEEVSGGLGSYIDKLCESTVQKERLFLNTYVTVIEPVLSHHGKLRYRLKLAGGDDYFGVNGHPVTFDAIVIATNGQQAGELLFHVPSHAQLSEQLRALKYYVTRVDVYGEKQDLPASYRVVNSDGAERQIIFWEPHEGTPILRTMNRQGGRPANTFVSRAYIHPNLSPDFHHAHQSIRENQGLGNIWIAGALAQGGDSHENAVDAGINAALGITDRFNKLQSTHMQVFFPNTAPDYTVDTPRPKKPAFS